MQIITINHGKLVENTLKDQVFFKNHTLTIKDKVVLDEPLKINLEDDNNESLKIVVGKSSEVKIILEVRSQELSKNRYHLHLDIHDNAHANYLLVSELLSKDAVLNHQFDVSKDATLNLIGALVSNVLTSHLKIDLNGDNATANVKSVAVSSDQHHQVIDVNINHYAPNTFADMANVGIVSKQGKVVLNGIAKIHKGMKNANAFQSLKGIITSDDALLEVNPILLIDEYDVKAGHGATIGKVEPEVLFYLMSRGLSKREAERLVIYGFLQPVIDEISDEALRDRFMDLVDKRI